jgi:hypothetical protein
MRNNMKKIASALGLVTVLAATTASATTRSIAAATVNLIATWDNNGAAGVVDYALVTGFSAAGTTCGQAGGMAILMIRDDDHGKRQLSLLTAALLAGRTVSVSVNDIHKATLPSGVLGNNCMLEYVTIGP